MQLGMSFLDWQKLSLTQEKQSEGSELMFIIPSSSI